MKFWGTEVECVSAIARRQRFAKLEPAIVSEGYARLDALRAGWHEVEAGAEIRETAKRFLKVHDLRPRTRSSSRQPSSPPRRGRRRWSS